MSYLILTNQVFSNHLSKILQGNSLVFAAFPATVMWVKQTRPTCERREVTSSHKGGNASQIGNRLGTVCWKNDTHSFFSSTERNNKKCIYFHCLDGFIHAEKGEKTTQYHDVIHLSIILLNNSKRWQWKVEFNVFWELGMICCLLIRVKRLSLCVSNTYQIIM